MRPIELLRNSKIDVFLSKLPKRISNKLKGFFSDPDNYQTIGLWISSVVTALVSVGYAKLFHYAENGFHEILKINPYYSLLLCPFIFFLAWFIVYIYIDSYDVGANVSKYFSN